MTNLNLRNMDKVFIGELKAIAARRLITLRALCEEYLRKQAEMEGKDA